jgi:hypothetical protein
MLKIGLTGGIGAGKSTVASIFKVLGIPVFDADATAKNLLNTDPILREQVAAAFGSETYKNGLLDKKYLATLVFNNPDQLAKLNALVHPPTIVAADKWASHFTDRPYIIKEAALLFALVLVLVVVIALHDNVDDVDDECGGIDLLPVFLLFKIYLFLNLSIAFMKSSRYSRLAVLLSILRIGFDTSFPIVNIDN